MLLLALDTSSPVTTACLLDDGAVRTELTVRAASPQSADHLGIVDTLLRQGRTTLGEVAAFAVTIGPGSFTGLRVGLSLLKGFTSDGARPLFPVSTLHALARTAAAGDTPVTPCLDARRGEVYAAVYVHDTATVPEGAYKPADFAALAGPGHAVWIGDGALQYRSVFAAEGRRFAGPVWNHPRAAAVASIAWERWNAGERPSGERLVPNYLRASEAERNQGSRKKV